jgi:uncharacterized protein YggU (UPF0235/DUF167 family)
VRPGALSVPPGGRIAVRVTPRAGADRFEIRPDGTLQIWVTAAPADGAANAAVIALVARALGAPKSALSMVRGAASRNKLLQIDPDVASRLA